MHKINVAITAGLLTAITTGMVYFIPALNRSEVLGILYFPAILLAVILSGGTHSPSEIAIWISFVTYTMLCATPLVVGFAFLYEFELLRRVSSKLQAAKKALIEDNLSECLAKFGEAVKKTESHRRKHPLFKSIDSIDLTRPDYLIGAQVITEIPKQRWVERLKSNLLKDMPPEKVTALQRLASASVV